MDTDSRRLVLRYEYVEPLPLGEVAASFGGTDRMYRQFLRSQLRGKVQRTQTRGLFVEHVHQKCIEISLVAEVLPIALAVAQDAQIISGFFREFQYWWEYFKGERDAPRRPTAADCNAMAKIVQPAMQQEGNSLNVAVNENHGTIIQQIFTDSAGAREIFGGAIDAKAKIQTPTNNQADNVVLRWSQASSQPGQAKVRTPDRGIIEQIDLLPYPIIFRSEDQHLKQKMIFGEENPFSFNFLVDVEVVRIENRIAAYRVTDFHDRFKPRGTALIG